MSLLLRPATPADPIERLALKHVSVDSLKAVACSFAGYHAIKCTPSTLTIATISSTDSQSFLDTAVAFAEAYLALAREVHLQCGPSRHIRDYLQRHLLSQCPRASEVT